MKGELYEYDGGWMTQAEISQKEEISRSTLADWYKKTGNMDEAVKQAKRSLAQRNIPYYDEVLSLKAIAKKEKVKFESLKKNFEECQDIYEAVRLTKASQLERNGSIPYYGQCLTIHAIAKLEDLDNKSLKRYYATTNDIYEAVRLAKEAQAKRNGTIPYYDQMMTISSIAKLEKVKRDTLAQFYDIYGNIYKAVLITKKSQLRRKQALHKGKMINYEKISKYLEVSPLTLDQMIESGENVDTIEKKIKKEHLIIDNSSLYNFCLEHSYNYWVIYYMIHTYGKTEEEALKIYLSEGQHIPSKWIYEKYHILFKHLALYFGMDSNRIIKIMREEDCDIERAITRLLFISNNENSDFKSIEIEWLYELYLFSKDLKVEEWTEAKNTFYITDKELHFIEEKSNKIEIIKRQLLLFEFSTIIDHWQIEDTLEMIELYGITNEEIILIITQLYSPFSQGILDPTSEHIEKQNLLTQMIINTQIKDEDILFNRELSNQEKETVLYKRQLLNTLIHHKIQNDVKKR